jgi:hypothetical protein
MKKVQRKCGTCKWLRPRSGGKPLWHGGAYKCQWTIAAHFKWPDSVSERAYGSPRLQMQNGPGTYMKPGDGKECPTWEQVAEDAGLGEESAANERTPIKDTQHD